MRIRRTLRGKVSVLGLAVITGWVIVLTVAFNLILAVQLNSQAKSALRNRASTAAATITYRADGSISSEHAGTNDAALDSGIWIYTNNGSYARPSGDEDLQHEADKLAHGTSRFVKFNDEDLLYSLPLIYKGVRVGTIVASLSLDPYRHASHAAWFGSAIVGALVLLGAYPVLRIAAGRALRPVESMTKQAGEWSASDITARFGTHQPYAEIQELAETLDGVLDRLSAVVRHERQLSAELSHELRTPLARVLAEIDLLLSRDHDNPEFVEPHLAIRQSAVSMERILETLLTAARTEIRDAPGRCELAVAVANAIAAVAVPDEVRMHSSVGSLVVGVEAAVVERVLAPVLGNACRYARTTVRVSAHLAPDGVIIDVDDDGPGVPVDQRETIFDPGFRADPDDGHDGAGLGLPLARRLARAASGDVTVTGPDSTFEVRLPRA